MYRIVFLTVVAVVAAGDDDGTKRCKHFAHPGLMRCCNRSSAEKTLPPDMKECFDLSRDPVSCPQDLCLAKKKGIVTDDGKLDLKKLEELTTKEHQGEPDLLDAIKTNCINGDLNLYGPPDFCDFVKMKHCLLVQSAMQCPEWNDKGDCKGTKELVEECAKMYS